MKVKLTNRDWSNSYRALVALANERLRPRVNYTITKNLKALEAQNTLIEESRQDLIKEHAAKDDTGNVKTKDDGSVIFEDKEAEEAFAEGAKELFETEEELDIRQVKLSDFGDVELPAALFIVLDWMIDEAETMPA